MKKTIGEKLKDYLVPVSDDRRQFRESLAKNRAASERLCREAEAHRRAVWPLAEAGKL